MTQSIEIVSYKVAIAQGLRMYCTGKPCKRGHVSARYTANRQCADCLNEDVTARREADPEGYLRRKRERYAANPTSERARSLAYYHANVEARAAYARIWHEKNPGRRRVLYREWAQANPGRIRAYANERRCAKLRRTPCWADLVAIRAFYDACPPGFQVDHVIPLRGRRASGLHVLENLQYLPDAENIAKGNRFTPYMVIHD